MKEPREIRIAWVIWNLLFHLNDHLWDRYEEEFLQLAGNPEELEEIDSYHHGHPNLRSPL